MLPTVGPGGGEDVVCVPTRTEALIARWREIDGLNDAQWGTPAFRHWQVATAEALRQALGFHPLVVEFGGLRFRGGPVSQVSSDELTDVPAAEHADRVRRDLAEARGLLVRALRQLGVDVNSLPTVLIAVPAPLAEAVAALPTERRASAQDAAERLAVACAASDGAWERAAAALSALLTFGPEVGQAAVQIVAARWRAAR